MKNSMLILMMVCGITFNLAAQSGPQIKFEKLKHDYGKIDQGANGNTEFVFTNMGTEPLIVSNAVGSCGCTVPEWPKQPILPGKKSSIKVTYDTNRVGPIDKSVTITSNSADASTMVLTIAGLVEAKATESGAGTEGKSLKGAVPASE